MKQHKLLIVLSVSSILLMSSCGGSGSKRPSISSVDKKDLYIYQYDKDQKTFVKSKDYIKTYFFNKSSVPYLSLKDFTSRFLSENIPSFYNGYTYSIDGGNAYISLNSKRFKGKATINTDSQTISYDTFAGYFGNDTEMLYPLSGIMLEGEYLFKDLKYDYKEGSIYSIDLTKYNIKAYIDNNEVYLPYHVCLSALGNNQDDNMVYNGNGYYLVSSFETTEEKLAGNKIIRDAIANNAFDADYQQYAYDHLAFYFDNYYSLDKRQKRAGNKEEYVYFKDGAYKELEKYKKDLMSTSPDVSNNALINFFNEYVNDGGHSKYRDYNVHATKKSTIPLTGEYAYIMSCYIALGEARSKAKLNPTEIDEDFVGYVKTYDDVLFVTMDRFSPNKPKYTKEDFSDSEYGKCAITILGRANEEVQNNKNIKNVVLDMSINTGGVGYMPLQILSWINKGNMNFTVKNNNDGTVLKGSGHADVNLDGVFDSKDYLPNDVNVYFVSAPTSFSSGNYVCCLASEVDGVKFIGERSGGGSCSVGAKSNAYGGIMNTCGYSQLCFNKEVDGKIVSDETGVTPSFYPIPLPENDMSNAPMFYDRQTIINKIHGKI